MDKQFKITETEENRLLNTLKENSKTDLEIIDRCNTSRGALFLVSGSEIGLLRIINKRRYCKDIEYNDKSRDQKTGSRYISFYVPSFYF